MKKQIKGNFVKKKVKIIQQEQQQQRFATPEEEYLARLDDAVLHESYPY